jgi:lipase maturation factor 1
LLLVGFAPALTAFLLWLFYMSLTVVGQDFLGFQWDNLLLEAGFLLIFLVPHPFRIHFKPFVRPSIVVIWLLRWLLFRLMFESGMVKILSGDTNWSHLTALTYHYWTQPLPNIFSWYANQLPLWFQQLSCALLFVIELFVPFLIFGGRWGRLIAFFGITGLQVLIMLTGNYCFFNLLAIGLCLTLVEDEHWTVMANLRNVNISNATAGAPSKEKANAFLGEAISYLHSGIFYKVVTGILALFILTVSLGLMANSFTHLPLSRPLEKLIEAVSPMRSINNYGLFAIMTTERHEIVLEGSNDGEHWRPYEFRYKPGDVNQAPRWVVPHQPRLDWQMWFAALGTWRENQWLLSLMFRLLQGEPSVVKLLAVNPFQDHPPRYIQATFWEYHFTNFKTRDRHGPWWHREIKGLYCPTVSLQQ